jgi:hypothetical protein
VRRDNRTYRELIEAGTASADKTAQRALRRGRAARCDVCGRIVSWRLSPYAGAPEPVLTHHTMRLGTGQVGGGGTECPGGGLPALVDPHVRPLT